MEASEYFCHQTTNKEPSWPWSYGSWIYNYLCNQCLSPLTLWVQIPLRRGVLDTTLCDKVCQWHTTDRWFSAGTPTSSTNKTDRNDITEILLKVALSTTKPNKHNENKTQAIMKWSSNIQGSSHSHKLYKMCYCKIFNLIFTLWVIVLNVNVEKSWFRSL